MIIYKKYIYISYTVTVNRLKEFLKRLDEIERREIDDYYSENRENRESFFNEYIDLIIDGVKTLSRKELMVLLEKMKWEL